jgi:hypothetical protein
LVQDALKGHGRGTWCEVVCNRELQLCLWLLLLLLSGVCEAACGYNPV